MSAGGVTVHAPRRSGVGRATVFVALLWRDLFVTGREFWVFLAQVAIQPLFMLFVFAKVLGELSFVSAQYSQVLLPGIVALTAFLTALQTVALPLVIEFGWTKEIEDRLLAPIPTLLVAVEKIVIAALRALAASLLMIPIGALILDQIPWRTSGLPLLLLVLALGGWAGGSIGLILGTSVPPTRINIMFALILTPLLFTGATQYPWPLLDRLPWFKVVTAFNPLTYVSEGVRAAMAPGIPHIAPWVCVLVLTVSGAAFLVVGMLGVQRRALD
ncbi:MAG TPA: ABC transporter permease [Actinomycetota bacterium]|nr:ABC transporter permease [Actinomycetota bacterium]